jgi:hypothetical protein
LKKLHSKIGRRVDFSSYKKTRMQLERRRLVESTLLAGGKSQKKKKGI